jgi:hypothetical protein
VIAAGPNDTVTLRNLRLNGIGAGINGIRFLSGASLVIERCAISGFTAAGINVALNAGGRVLVSKSALTNNLNGVVVDGTAGGSGTVIKVLLSETKASNNSGNGILASTAAGHSQVGVVIERADASNNVGIGIQANGLGVGILLGNSTVSTNGVGVSQANGGGIASYKTNMINGNGADGTPLTAVGLN